MTKKIALIGSAPSSVALAPYDDPSWEIWACSPGARPYVKRVNAWFELHLWEPNQPWFSPEYVSFMAGLPCPVYMLEKVDAIPASVPYPKNEILDAFGVGAVYFYTSSLSWMFAAALAAGATEIGLWGVDMSAAEEVYTHQRAGCQYFIGKALEAGVKVTIPPQSDLMRPSPLYGFNELDGMHQKLLARDAELTARLNNATNIAENATREVMYLRGAIEDVGYTRKTFVADTKVMEMLASAKAACEAVPTAEHIPLNISDEAAAELRQTAQDFVEKAGQLSGIEVTEAVIGPNDPIKFTVTQAPDHLADMRRPTIDEIKDRITARPRAATWESTPIPDVINGAI
jgi:hypothetical protein